MPDFDRIRVLLHSDGRLHWEPGGIFKTTCDIDIGHFPFDTQHCPMLIGAYSYYRHAQSLSTCHIACLRRIVLHLRRLIFVEEREFSIQTASAFNAHCRRL